MNEGEHWGFRANRHAKFAEVKVLKIGTARPPRVKVEYVDDHFEGKQAWVSPARLEVLWSDIDEYIALDKRWKAFEAVEGPGQFFHEAALDVFVAVGIEEIAEYSCDERTGAIDITDVDALAELTGLSRDFLVSSDLTIFGDGVIHAPWEITEAVCKALAPGAAPKITWKINDEFRRYEKEMVTGAESLFHKDIYGDPLTIPGERIARFYEEHIKPVHAILREWMQDPGQQYNELVEAEVELARVGDIAQRAIKALRQLRSFAKANQLQEELVSPRSRWTGHGVDAEKVAPYTTPYKWILRDNREPDRAERSE